MAFIDRHNGTPRIFESSDFDSLPDRKKELEKEAEDIKNRSDDLRQRYKGERRKLTIKVIILSIILCGCCPCNSCEYDD
jgi:hypothetical protein